MDPKNKKRAHQYYWYVLRDESTQYDAMQRGDYATAMVAAQQSAEKSMKGILQAKGDLSKATRTTHDLWKLFCRCQRHGYELEGASRADLNRISNAYFSGRYPKKNQSHPPVYTYEDAKFAEEIATSMWCCFKQVVKDIEEEENVEFRDDSLRAITVYDDRWDDEPDFLGYQDVDEEAPERILRTGCVFENGVPRDWLERCGVDPDREPDDSDEDWRRSDDEE